MQMILSFFTECATCEECYERIEKDMDNINRWLNINKLKLNLKLN